MTATGSGSPRVASGAMTTPHLVALDIDGTTVNHEGELSAAVRDVVREVAQAGHHVTIATGRAVLGTLPVLDRLGLTTGYAVCANGAITLRLDPSLDDGYEIIEAVTFANKDPYWQATADDSTSVLPAANVSVKADGGRLTGELPAVSWSMIRLAVEA